MAAGGSNRLIGMRQAAQYLDVPAGTFYKKWKDWGLTGHRIGRSVKFRERELERFIDSRAEAA